MRNVSCRVHYIPNEHPRSYTHELMCECVRMCAYACECECVCVCCIMALGIGRGGELSAFAGPGSLGCCPQLDGWVDVYWVVRRLAGLVTCELSSARVLYAHDVYMHMYTIHVCVCVCGAINVFECHLLQRWRPLIWNERICFNFVARATSVCGLCVLCMWCVCERVDKGVANLQ